MEPELSKPPSQEEFDESIHAQDESYSPQIDQEARDVYESQEEIKEGEYQASPEDRFIEPQESYFTDEHRRHSVTSSVAFEDPERSGSKTIDELEREIIRSCKESRSLWEDDDFPAAPTSLFKDPDVIPDYAKANPCEEWVRPKDIADNPVMFLNGAAPGDVQQGALGDCWFMGSLSVLATRPEMLDRLFVHTEHLLDCGFVTCQFYKNGEWQQVIIDTRLPYNRGYASAIYGHCKDVNEFWLPLIEKAYAKLHKTYESLNGGKMSDALVDLTGEAVEKFNLRDPHTTQLIENGEMWNMLLRYYKSGCLLGCTNSVKSQDGESGEEMGSQGIWNNHAYGILEVRDIKGLKLIRIRNPWGEGEWKGTFCDEDEEWDKHRGLKDELGYEFGKDGTWWMTYEDWTKHYNRLYVCRVFPEKWQKYSIDGKWEGIQAGGPPPMQIDRDEEVAEHVKMDSDDKWFNNPQFRITVTRKTQIFISLMQADEKLSGKPYLPCNFLLIKTNDKKNRIWEKDKDDVILSAAEGMQRFGQREISKDITLEPPEGKPQGHFIIIPNLEIDGKRLEEIRNTKRNGRQFWLRVFSQFPVEVVELADTKEIREKGEWTEDTAGGRRTLRNGKDNPLWCKNPQYFLNVTTPTLLKIILRKVGGLKKSRGVNIGMVVCKAATKAPAKKVPLVTGTLKRTQMKTTSTPAQEISHQDMQRKLQILPNEWYVESHYQSEELSCMFLKLDPNHGPFLIVPTLSQELITAQYSLIIYSNFEVTLKRLEDAHHVAISGEWKEGCAGGSHLYDKHYETKVENMTWPTNPKFLLTFRHSDEPVKANITLSRPERLWSTKIARVISS
jgi:hypothetical protein